LALVLMVGIVIDDAIVVLENIFRFVEEKKMSPMEAARKGTAEIALAVLATTLSLVVIFIPVSFMSSISGRFLYQFGITAAVAVMVSLLVSFTLTPTLSARMLRPEKIAAMGHGTARSRGGFYRIIDAVYTALLRFVMRFRIPVAIVAIGVMASAVPLYRMVPQDFLPADIDESEFEMRVSAPEGLAFAPMNEIMKSIEADLMAMPEVRTILAETGGGFIGGVNSGSLYVRIAPHGERYFSISRLWRETLRGDPAAAFRGNYTQADVMQKIREQMRKYRPVRVSVRNFSSFNLGGGSFEIDFAIRGPDLEQLANYTQALRERAVSDTERGEGLLAGIADADTTLRLDKPELHVAIDRERAADLGIRSRDIGIALRLMVGGDTEVSRFRDLATNEDYDVQLRLTEADRSDPSTIPLLYLPAQDGQLIELRNIASLEEATSAARIDRLNRQRAANLRAQVAPGYALADRLAALQQAADELNMPPAYTTMIMGRGRELERTFYEFTWAFVLSIIFMYMILAANYESLIHPFTILLSLPLSIPFALLSLYLSGGSLNLYSAVGILVLFGVVKKNAILQIDHMNQLRERGMERFAAIIQGNRDRLRPILMTTLALVGGMMPLAMGTGPGAEERRAVAIVVIGGQTLSLLLTLLVTPVAYSLFDDIGSLLSRHRHKAPTESARGQAPQEALVGE
jgi:hydrophobic/amphiphilic exporter-1 (mainly G- bacteria), HAE1 family